VCVDSVCRRWRRCGGDTLCATLYSGGCGGGLCLLEMSEVFGGAGGDTLDARGDTLYAGGFGWWALFAGGVGCVGGAGEYALYAALYAGSRGG